MKSAEFTYHQPESATQAVELLEDLGDEAKILSGGQSLLPIMNMRLAEPGHLIDVGKISELKGYQESPDEIRYGAAVTHAMIEDGLVPDACGGLLRYAARGIGYRAIRNRGTVGGSLAHADSSAEWPTVLAAADARVVARSSRGEREIPVREFFHGFFSTALAPDELLTSCIVPLLAPDTYWGMYKTNRKAGEFAESLAVVTYQRHESGVIERPNVWLGAARDVPVRLSQVEAEIQGRAAEEIELAQIREHLLMDLKSGWDDVPAAERHRLQLHSVTVHRALSSTRRAKDDE